MFYRMKQCPGLWRYIFGVAQFCQGKSPIFQHTASFSLPRAMNFGSLPDDSWRDHRGTKSDLTNVVIYAIFRASF